MSNYIFLEFIREVWHIPACMLRWTAPRKLQWTLHFRACSAWWQGRPVFAGEGGKNWSSTLRSPEHVYDSRQESNIHHKESDHSCSSFPKRMCFFWQCFKTYWSFSSVLKAKNLSLLSVHSLRLTTASIPSLGCRTFFNFIFSFEIFFRLADWLTGWFLDKDANFIPRSSTA